MKVHERTAIKCLSAQSSIISVIHRLGTMVKTRGRFWESEKSSEKLQGAACLEGTNFRRIVATPTRRRHTPMDAV
jgi:hypothetical protein